MGEETFTPAQLNELTKPKEAPAPQKQQGILETLQEANKFIGTIKSLVVGAQGLANIGKSDEKGGNVANKVEKEINREMATKGKAPANSSKPRGAPKKKSESKLLVDVAGLKKEVISKLDLIGDDMTGKETKEMIKPLLEGDMLDGQIETIIKGACKIE